MSPEVENLMCSFEVSIVIVSDKALISLQILENSVELIVTTLPDSVSGTASYSLSNDSKFKLNSEYFSFS